jgi:TatD DNase family protein
VYCDTHCHLDLPQFDSDRAAVIERAEQVGVRTIVAPAIDLDSCRRVLALADRQPGVYAAVGVHPNDCADFDEGMLKALRALAQHPKVVAIGEIGLDYYWEKAAHDHQKRVLRAQLELAAELGLPVILHSRNGAGDRAACHADLLCEIAQMGLHIRKARGESAIIGIWHAFSGELAQAQEALRLGLVLGLGGPLTFQNARGLHALAPQLPLNRLLLETDAPYLAPHPYRGQRNEPAYVPLIAGRLAQLVGTTSDAVALITTATAHTCFGFASGG